MARTTKIIVRDGLEYTASNNRMRYNPEFHENHGKPYTRDDLVYMCAMWGSIPIADIAMAIGKTHGSVASKVYTLKRQGRFDHFKKVGQKEVRFIPESKVK